MSCSNNNDVLNGASTSVLPTSSPITDFNHKTTTTSSTQLQKPAIVHAGNQIIITTSKFYTL
jgi:hypothetical protein